MPVPQPRNRHQWSPFAMVNIFTRAHPACLQRLHYALRDRQELQDPEGGEFDMTIPR